MNLLGKILGYFDRAGGPPSLDDEIGQAEKGSREAMQNLFYGLAAGDHAKATQAAAAVSYFQGELLRLRAEVKK